MKNKHSTGEGEWGWRGDRDYKKRGRRRRRRRRSYCDEGAASLSEVTGHPWKREREYMTTGSTTSHVLLCSTVFHRGPRATFTMTDSWDWTSSSESRPTQEVGHTDGPALRCLVELLHGFFYLGQYTHTHTQNPLHSSKSIFQSGHLGNSFWRIPVKILPQAARSRHQHVVLKAPRRELVIKICLCLKDVTFCLKR